VIKHIKNPTAIESQGNIPKLIEEFIGRINTETQDISVARMKCPAGWVEPGQTPAFDEYTIVLEGLLLVNTGTKVIDVKAGEAVIVEKGEWVQYSTPTDQGAQYIAICVPAFSTDAVHRDKK
jgi:quercetin dioxygenase-like cupin family protein